MRKCTNCKIPWNGLTTVGPLDHCPICGDNTEGDAVEAKPEVNPEVKDAGVLDLNKDGKVDGKDVSTLIRKIRGSRKSRKSREGAKKWLQ